MTLQTRKPTGAIPWPVILLEGDEKAGKTVSLVQLSASAKVGRTAILFLGEPVSDEYGAWPGARYEIILHDGTWPSIIGQVEDARAEAQRAFDAGEAPFVLGIDSATAEWNLLKDWGSAKARSAPSNQRRLAKDPAAEIKVHTNIWNDVGARHARLMTLLLTFPGIVIITARGKEVAAMGADGNPIEGKKDYRVEGHKNLCYDVSCWVRMFRDKPAIVVGARSVHAGIRPGRDEPKELDPDWSLEGLIFTALKCDPKRPAVQEMVTLRTDTTPAEMRDEALDPNTTPERIRELWKQAGTDFPEAEVMNGTGDDENLVALLARVGKERVAEHAGLQTAPAGEAAAARQQLEADLIPEDLREPDAVTVAAARAAIGGQEIRAEREARNGPDGGEDWVTTAAQKAATFATVTEGQQLWRDNAAKHKAEAITTADRKHVEMLIQARLDDLRAKPLEGVVVPEPPADDPLAAWREKVTGILTGEDADAALADLEVSRKNGMDGRDYAVIKAEIRAKAASVREVVPA